MTLALIAGAGALPALLASRQAEPPLIASLVGFLPDDDLRPDITFRIEHLGSLLADLTAHGVSRICMVGRVARPVVDPSEIDAATRPLIPRVMDAMAQGDDGALRALITIFEEADFAVVGAHEIAHDLLPEAGCLVGEVSPRHETDAARGAEIVAAMGAADIGQACIVADGQALAIEALPGTDWMLRSLTVSTPSTTSDFTDPIGMASDWLSGPKPAGESVTRDPALPTGGLLFKAPKPKQELRVDMPTIGPETVRLAAKAKLDGIVIKAGQVLLIDREKCMRLAREAGLFIWVRP